MEILISLGALAISLYGLYEIDKMKKANPEKVEKERKDTKQIKITLKELKDHDCEIVVKDAMIFIDAVFNIEGTVIDVDDEWVLIRTTGKKLVERIIRISLIKDVKAIVK